MVLVARASLARLGVSFDGLVIRSQEAPYSSALKHTAYAGSRTYKPHLFHRSSFVSPTGFCRYASTDATALRRTGLYSLHVENGGKMVPFAGYEMPVSYNDLSVGESHRWTREKASLFDVGHM